MCCSKRVQWHFCRFRARWFSISIMNFKIHFSAAICGSRMSIIPLESLCRVLVLRVQKQFTRCSTSTPVRNWGPVRNYLGYVLILDNDSSISFNLQVQLIRTLEDLIWTFCKISGYFVKFQELIFRVYFRIFWNVKALDRLGPGWSWSLVSLSMTIDCQWHMLYSLWHSCSFL